MAIVIRVIALLACAVLVVAQTQSAAPDTLALDSLFVLTDTLTTDSSSSSVSAWWLPLALVAATGGLFVLLFTSRSK